MLRCITALILAVVACWPTAVSADTKDKDPAANSIELGWKAWRQDDPRAALQAFKRAGELGNPAGYWFAHLVHKNLPLAKASMAKHRYHLLDDSAAYSMQELAWKRGYPEAVWWFARSMYPESQKSDIERRMVRENQERWEKAAVELRYPPALAYFAEQYFREYLKNEDGFLPPGYSRRFNGRFAYVLSISTLDYVLTTTQENKLNDDLWIDAIKTSLRISKRLKQELPPDEIKGHEEVLRAFIASKRPTWSELAEKLRLSTD